MTLRVVQMLASIVSDLTVFNHYECIYRTYIFNTSFLNIVGILAVAIPVFAHISETNATYNHQQVMKDVVV